MDKAKSKRDGDTQKGIAHEITEALKNPGTTEPDRRVWIREDGAVCFGDCVSIKPNEDGALDLTIEPDSCGELAGGLILEHLVKTAGKGVRIIVPASETTMKKMSKETKQ